MTRKVEKGQKNEVSQESNKGGSGQLHQIMEIFPSQSPQFICLEILFHFLKKDLDVLFIKVIGATLANMNI